MLKLRKHHDFYKLIQYFIYLFLCIIIIMRFKTISSYNYTSVVLGVVLYLTCCDFCCTLTLCSHFSGVRLLLTNFYVLQVARHMKHQPKAQPQLRSVVPQVNNDMCAVFAENILSVDIIPLNFLTSI